MSLRSVLLITREIFSSRPKILMKVDRKTNKIKIIPFDGHAKLMYSLWILFSITGMVLLATCILSKKLTVSTVWLIILGAISEIMGLAVLAALERYQRQVHQMILELYEEIQKGQINGLKLAKNKQKNS